MEIDLLSQDKFFVASVAPEIIEIDERFIAEQEFIDTILAKSPNETVEDVSSVVHETNRIPDPRILLIQNGKIVRLDNKPVDDSIEKNSYLGQLEYQAFKEINTWTKKNNRGVEIWFSAPFGDIYPVSKIDFGEIRFSSDLQFKVLLKKAVLLDIDSQQLLNIANEFVKRTGFGEFSSTEQLRSYPLFCTRDEMNTLLEMISNITDQTQMVINGADLARKIDTYEKLETEYREINSSYQLTNQGNYYALRQRAEEERMIGDKSESCPTGMQTSLQAFSGNFEGKLVRNCGNCGAPINAVISKGYRCPSCGGVYEGC